MAIHLETRTGVLCTSRGASRGVTTGDLELVTCKRCEAALAIVCLREVERFVRAATAEQVRRLAAPTAAVPPPVAQALAETREPLFYIQETQTIVGNCVLWWGPDRCGYTCDLGKAGLYTAAQLKACCLRPTDEPWPKETVDAIAARHVHSDRIREVACAAVEVAS